MQARQPGSSQLLFRVCQWELAVPSRLVSSIVLSPSILPVPGMPVWLAGLLQSGDAATLVIDLRSRLGLGTGTAPAAVVVIEPATPKSMAAEKGRLLGLLVDKVLDTAVVRSCEVKEMRVSSSILFKDLLHGAWRGRSRACYLLDIDKLIPADLEVYVQTIISAFR